MKTRHLTGADLDEIVVDTTLLLLVLLVTVAILDVFPIWAVLAFWFLYLALGLVAAFVAPNEGPHGQGGRPAKPPGQRDGKPVR
ncbi:MAG: hypothetical protein WDO13_11855 [Verrucomicrobiota bacterium]